jgi:hypothetical protein
MIHFSPRVNILYGASFGSEHSSGSAWIIVAGIDDGDSTIKWD